MSYQGNYPPSTPLASNQLALGIVAPSNLTTGGPSWDGSGNLTVSGTGNSSFGGNLGVGTTTPSQKLTVVDATSANMLLSGSTTNFITYAYSGFAVSGTTSNTPWLFYTNNAERMRIDTSGVVQVGGTTVANTVGYVNSRTNARAWARWNGANGTITSSYNVSSVTRSSAGQYVVNFTTALADANYAPMLSCAGDSTVYNGYGVFAGMTSAPTTSSFAIWTKSYNGTATDPASVQITVFGN